MPRSTPTVSVVIPAYNRADLILKTIESVINQIHPPQQIIVVDDGSTDDTTSVVKAIMDPRLSCISQANKKSAGAYNTGIRASRSQYVMTVDSDDILEPSLLAKQVAMIEEDPEIGYIGVGRAFADRNGRLIGKEWTPWLWGHNLQLEDWLKKGCPLNHSGNLIRRDWLDRLGLMDENAPLNEDYDLYLQLAYEGCKMVWLKEVLVRYRLHDSNLSADARAMRDGHKWVLDKFFSKPSLPESIRSLEPAVLTRQHLQSSGWAYACGDHGLAHEELKRALAISPGLLEGEHNEIIGALTDVCTHPIVKDPFAFLSDLENNLPPGTEALASNIKARSRHMKFMHLRERGRQERACRESV